MKNFQKIFFLAILFLGIFGLAESSQAANIYVDQTLSSDCISGNYSTSVRDCSGSDGNAYNTIQKAIVAMNGGDDIYVRGGTYEENGGFTLNCTDCAASNRRANIEIPKSKNGTIDNWSSIQSYPGEWAILVGDNLHQNYDTGGQHPVLGHYGTDKEGLHDIKYWKFERLEIKGGSNSGLHVNGGPFIVRHCYFHDNYQQTDGENPAAIVGMVPQDSIIEFNYFKNNGSLAPVGNSSHIAFFSDYRNLDIENLDPNHATMRNEVRYNLFDTGGNGFKHKNVQDLTNKNTISTYKSQGDKIHHNIFLRLKTDSVYVMQDYAQVYNNITAEGLAPYYGAFGMDYWLTGAYERDIYYATFYNNTIKNAQFNYWRGTIQPSINPYLYLYNNIFDNFGINSDGFVTLNIAGSMAGGGIVDLTNLKIDYNYFYRPGYADSFRITKGTENCIGYMTPEEYNSCYNTNNYVKSSSEGSDNLYDSSFGAGQQITRREHVVEDSKIIANAGIGSSHPYLSGVSIPSYVGATNPDDNDWVAGVLGLATVSNLQNAGSDDPTWIEGSESTSDTTPPASPTGLSVN